MNPSDNKVIYFNDKFFYLSVLMMVIHQLLIGGSVISIYFASNYANSNKNISVLFFYLFIFCMIAPYFFGTIANYLSSLWSLSCVKRFIVEKSEVYRNSSPLLEGTNKFREGIIAYSKSSSDIIKNTTEYYSDLVSSSLNSAISILAICYVVNINMLFAYMCSGILIYFSISLYYKKYKEKSKSELLSLNELSSELLTIGNNYIYGGEINRKTWRKNVNKRLDAYTNKYKSKAFINSIGNLLIGISSIFPISLYLIYLTSSSNNLSTMEYISILVISTRILHICNSIYDLFSLCYKKSSIEGQVNGLIEMIFSCKNKFSFDSKKIDWPSNINTSKIYLEKKAISEYTPIEFIEEVTKIGLHTITGRNGAGKSTILKWIKQISNSKDSYYVTPEKKVLWYFDSYYSSGEYVSYALKCLTEKCNEKIMIILDEWDANLDQYNKLNCVNYIDKISNYSSVIQVIHHR